MIPNELEAEGVPDCDAVVDGDGVAVPVVVGVFVCVPEFVGV